MTLKVNVIFAHQDGIIGVDGAMPWRIPYDLKWFRSHTVNNAIIMGHATFKSIGYKPLPDRFNVVLTRGPEIYVDRHGINVKAAGSLDEALRLCALRHFSEAFIIGGAEVLEEGIKIADKLHITKVSPSVAIPASDNVVRVNLDTSDFDLMSSHEVEGSTYETWIRRQVKCCPFL